MTHILRTREYRIKRVVNGRYLIDIENLKCVGVAPSQSQNLLHFIASFQIKIQYLISTIIISRFIVKEIIITNQDSQDLISTIIISRFIVKEISHFIASFQIKIHKI